MFADQSESGPLGLADRLWAINWPFVLVITMIAAIGVTTLYSVAGGSLDPWAERHVIRYCFGLAILFTVALIDIEVLVRAAYPVYALGLLTLVAVLLFGTEISGAVRWLNVGGYRFQPSDFMKMALVLALARYYQWLPPKKVSHPLWLIPPLLLIAMPMGLVALEPDLGTALLYAIVGIGVLFLAGVSWMYYVAGGIAAVGALPVLWNRLHDYQKSRVLTFLDPDRDPLGAGYHITQSKIAFGSGGIFGKGYMQGTQSQLNFLPEKHTDFIFTMYAEEWGFVGAVVLLTLFAILVFAILYMALRCRSPFARLVAAGAGLTLFVYVFINAAMVMGLVPVVGVPLPLVSYGGTSMLTMMFAFGLVLNAYVNRRRHFAKHAVSWLT